MSGSQNIIAIGRLEEEPYGLLNIYAHTPFTLVGRRYVSVAECMFFEITQIYTDNMDQLHNFFRDDPHKAMKSLKTDYKRTADKKFKEYILAAMDVKLENEDMARYIGYNFVFDDHDYLTKYLNNKVSKAKEDFSKRRAVRIIEGVRRTLKEGTSLPDGTNFGSLMQYEMQTIAPLNDPALNYLDYLVPYLKFEKQQAKNVEQYKRDLATFKASLRRNIFRIKYSQTLHNATDAQVDEVIRKYDEKRTIAEREQEEDLYYKDFTDGKLDARFYKSLKIPSNPMLAFQPPEKPKRPVSQQDSTFSPFLEDSVQIDLVTYETPYHYAYSKLLADIDYPHNINSRRYSLQNLRDIYKNYREDEYYPNQLTRAANVAISANLKSHSVLGHLLATTVSKRIKYVGDGDDKILGTDKYYEGKNKIGLMYEGLRNQIFPDAAEQTLYRRMFDNIYLKRWVMKRIQDILRVRMLFKTKPNLQQLYRFPKSKGIHKPAREELCVIEKEFRDHKDLIQDAWELIYPQIYVLSKLSDAEMTAYVVKSQELNLGKLKADDANAAFDFIRRYYDENKDQLNVQDVYYFVGTVLSGRPEIESRTKNDALKAALRPRVAYWANVAATCSKN